MWTSLIGFMACGKSTVARRLQAATRRPLAAVDELVAERAGRSVANLFAASGEAAFRDLELAALTALDPDRHLIVDTGGGVIETPAAVELLRRRGPVLWLDAPWDLVRERLKESPGGERPLVERLGFAGLEELYRRRRPLYAAAADFRLTAGVVGVDDLARTVMLRSLLWQRRRQGREG